MLVINGVQIQANYSGAGVYFYKITKRLMQKWEDGLIYTQFDSFENKKNWRVETVKYVKRDLIRWLWVQFILPFKIKNSLDILFCTFSEAPIFCKCKTVIVVHDLIPLKFKKEHSRKLRFYYKYILPKSLKKSTRIIAISESVKKDILKFFTFISPDKIKVIYNGYEKKIFNASKPGSESINFKNKLGFEDYILYVGRISEIKNTISLIKAFGELIKTSDINLLIVGRDESGVMHEGRRYIIEHKFEDKIKIIDYLSEDELSLAYKNAKIFVLPSFSEGFGIPVIEAMGCGIPVIVSEIPSLNEIADDAAMKFDPSNYYDLAEKLSQLLHDGKLYNHYKIKGLERAKNFDWDITAELTNKILVDINIKN